MKEKLTNEELSNNIDAIYEVDESAAKRRGINSVETGVRVLDAIISLQHPSTLKTIADRAELETSQTYRYVSSLLNCHIIKQDIATGLYDLGPKALHIGLAAMARLDPLAVAEGEIKQFSMATGNTCLLNVWGSNGPTIIRWYHGLPPIFTTLAVGSALPVFSSATGQVFLSFLDKQFIEPHLQTSGLKTPLESNAEIMALREKVRSSGIGSVDSTVIPGLRGYASPIFGMQNSLVAVCTLILSETLPKSQDKKKKSDLLKLCRNISGKLGGRWPVVG